MDLVTEVIRLSRFRGALGLRIAAGSDWTTEISEYPGMAVHAVLAGTVWLRPVGGEPLELRAGDVVVLPQHMPHLLSDAPDGVGEAGGLRTRPPAGGNAHEPLRLGSGPARNRLMTLFYDCDHSTRTQVLGDIPGPVHVPGAGTSLIHVAELIERELAQVQIGTPTIVEHLIEIVLIQLVRAWSALNPLQQRGTWLGWVEDDVVREAIDLIHADPAAEWTIETLAAKISVSRATLARRFQASMGRSPSTYLAQWRMDLAAVSLRDTRDTVEDIAARVGYRSVPSFTRAFARDRGCSPGLYRARMRADLVLPQPE
ncbi:AraC family transcriptional regulator [Kineosporia sp. NBRC 101677]|uniref:AraC family transcriptional regulator n=1 Tax=Kineosporia sp. NBRC 101677 TaxID=3032197 RepID=UPI00249FFF41|nr:AraC family transcriptional regulator [Kineosporia sp. NBRC 101677]GLY16671.1 AraC family transcriptional regulator [Kineosporia sp. NBRC 101677]